MNKQIIFIHIPKTAGYTISRCLDDINVLKDGYGFNQEIARNIIKIDDLQNNFTIIAVVRNPYDRLWSIYEFYRKKREDIEYNITFENFILNFEKDYYLKKPQFNTCFDYLTDVNGKLLATDILKFENLQIDYNNFCKKYQIINNLVERNKNDFKNLDIEYEDLYTEEMKKIVEKIFHKDFELFNYSYDLFIKNTKNK